MVSVSASRLEPNCVAPAITFIAWPSGHANCDTTLCTDLAQHIRAKQWHFLLTMLQLFVACHPVDVIATAWLHWPSATVPKSNQMELLASFSQWHDYATADGLP